MESVISGKALMTKNNTFIYDKDSDISADDLSAMIAKNESLSNDYNRDYNYYVGNHKVLKGRRNKLRPDNRIVANIASELVDTFTGYFMGIPPKITLDDDTQNDNLQHWLDMNSFQDKLAEVSKQSDIYGRSYMLLYQDEQANTKVTVLPPTNAFMIYDDTVEQLPLAFVRYGRDAETNEINGTLYTATEIKSFNGNGVFTDSQINVFQSVPAIEFFNNEERLSLIDKVNTLIDAYDKALSQKANQVEYFDNAYLKILGMQLPKDKNGNVKLDMLGNQIIYSPDNMNGNVDVGFLEKPDGDVMQENYLNRLIDNIYQVSMVSNLRDEAFSGNSSGVAIQYKMLPMQNMASTKERKFTQALRNLLAVGFKLGTIAEVPEGELYSALKFKFTRNMPRNDADEAATAATLNGIVSKETQLSVLSIVDDPKKEIERMQEEEKDGILQNIDIQNQAMKNMEGAEDEKNTEEQA